MNGLGPKHLSGKKNYRHLTVKQTTLRTKPKILRPLSIYSVSWQLRLYLPRTIFHASKIKPVGETPRRPARLTAIRPPSPVPDTIPRDGDQIAELTLVPMTFRGISEFVYGTSPVSDAAVACSPCGCIVI